MSAAITGRKKGSIPPLSSRTGPMSDLAGKFHVGSFDIPVVLQNLFDSTTDRHPSADCFKSD